MNWKLIFLLSLLGLIMGICTISLISQTIENICWPVICVFSAWMIVRQAPGRLFLHGLFLGLANCVWVTGAHVVKVNAYMVNHPHMASMSPFPYHPRWDMLLFGPLIGAISGVIIGLLALLIAAILRKRPVPA